MMPAATTGPILVASLKTKITATLSTVTTCKTTTPTKLARHLAPIITQTQPNSTPWVDLSPEGTKHHAIIVPPPAQLNVTTWTWPELCTVTCRRIPMEAQRCKERRRKATSKAVSNAEYDGAATHDAHGQRNASQYPATYGKLWVWK